MRSNITQIARTQNFSNRSKGLVFESYSGNNRSSVSVPHLGHSSASTRMYKSERGQDR